MRRIAIVPLLLLLGVACLVGISSAGSSTHGDGLPRHLMDGITVPTQWEGIWDVADSTYNNCSAPASYAVAMDTLCGGGTYTQPTNLTCTGTADATTFHMHCVGTMFVDPCTVDYDFTADGTRTADDYRTVTVINGTYSGGICTGLPPQCTRIVSYGHRTGSAPVDFCQTTEVRRSTWGQLKILYR